MRPEVLFRTIRPAVLICGIILAITARGQDAPQTQPAEAEAEPSAPRRNLFALNPNDLYVGFESNYQWRRVDYEDRRGRPGWTQRNTDLRVIEKLGFGLDGYVYDPNLLEYDGHFELGLAQTKYTERVDRFEHSDRDNGELLRYDFSIDALKTKPLSVHAFARRTDDRVARRFLPSLRETQDAAGVSVLALTGPVTTEIGFDWQDIDREGNIKREDNEHLENSRFYLDSKWQIAEDHRFRLSYEHERQSNDYQGSQFSFETERDELRLEHELGFGEGNKHRLDTFFWYNDERGDYPIDILEFVPRLTLQHTEKFKTIYRYGFYQTEQAGLEIGQHKVDVEALYQATENLLLSADVYGLYERVVGDVETHEYGFSGDAGYHRETSSGEFNLNANLAYYRTETTGDAGRRVVRNEAHTMSARRPDWLRNQGVLPETIVAHDGRYSRLYINGVDYVFTIVRGRAYIRRIPFGRIAEDDVVYFDYAYVVPTESAIDTVRADLLVEHRFKFGLVPYYMFEGRFQNADERSVGSPWFRDNQNRHRIGARYERSRWQVGAEYEIFDDTVEPYDAVHLTGNAALLRTVEHNLDLNSELSFYRFEGGVDKRRVWWFDIDVKDKILLNQYLSLLAGVGYRHESDSVDGRTNAADIEVGFSYTRNYLTIELTAEYDLISIVGNRDQSFGLFLNVKRDLSHLLPKRSRP